MIRIKLKRISPQYARFLLTGAAFTLAGPALFFVLALLWPPLLASVLTELSMHSLRCVVYNMFVFASAGSGIRTYLTAAVPMSLVNFGLVYFLQDILPLWQLAFLIGVQGATIGYFWSRLCYRYDLSARLRSRWR
ncbi:MAG: hypothetical protein ACK5Q7_06505 [Cyanobacteriota bacterium]